MGERLVLLCTACEQVEHMDPSEWRRNGDADHVMYNHGRRCQEPMTAAIVPTEAMRDFYASSSTSDRLRVLQQWGRYPDDAPASLGVADD